MEYDLHHDVNGLVALNQQTIATDTTTNGNWIDTAGFNAIEFFTFLGNWTDGAYALTVSHADESDQSDAETVPAADLLGTPASLGADNAINRVGYIGGTLADGSYAKRRYVRLNVVSTGTTSGSPIGAVAVLGIPDHGPVADQ